MKNVSNKTISRSFIEEVWNKGNINLMDELVAEDVVFSDPLAGEANGREALREYVNMQRSAFPDIRFTIEEQIEEGDTVATHWTATGTHKGSLMGIPPTGKTTTNTGVVLVRAVNGKGVEVTAIWDALGFMQQLGVVGRIAAMVSPSKQ